MPGVLLEDTEATRKWCRGGRKEIVPVFVGLGEWRVLNIACDYSSWSPGWNGLGEGAHTLPQLSSAGTW